MVSRKRVSIAILCFFLIAGTPLGSMSAGKIPTSPSNLGITSGTVPPIFPPIAPVTPPGNDGLLSGMTPGNYKIPSGWSLVRTQDFEGSQPADELWTSGSTATTSLAHSGSRSLMRTYGSSASDFHWALDEGHVGSFTEVYLSFYEYIDSTALFNDEFWVGQFTKASPFQEIVMAWLWAPAYNQPSATFYIVPQGNHTSRYGTRTATVPKGAWVQWEMHYRPNTPGNSDGFLRVYKGGALFSSAENANLNGTVDMANCRIQAGGVYTRLVWMTDSPTCSHQSSGPGVGTDYCTSSMGWEYLSFSSTIPGPALPAFNRYFDDIIVLKK